MKPINYTIAIDPSSTALGYAIFVDGKHFLSGSVATQLSKIDAKDTYYNSAGNKLLKTLRPALDELQSAIVKVFDTIAVCDEGQGVNTKATLNVIVEYPYGHFSHGVNNVIRLAFVAGMYYNAIFEIVRVSARQISPANQHFKLVQASNWQSLAFGTNLDRNDGKQESIRQALLLIDWKPGDKMITDDQADAINMAYWGDKLVDVDVRRREKLANKALIMAKLPSELATLQKRVAKLLENAQTRKDKKVLKHEGEAREQLIHKHATYFLSQKDYDRLLTTQAKIRELEAKKGEIRNESKAVFRR